MPNTVVLDVLIVYNSNIASSASDGKVSSPFSTSGSNKSCNASYKYMLRYCESIGIRAGFTTSQDIIGPGKCSTYWIISKSRWVKIDRPAFAGQIFDKFSPTSIKDKKIRTKLFANTTVSPYNSREVYEMFFDKQNTYDAHPSCTIPTISLQKPTLDHISAQCQKLAILTKLSNSLDYTTDIIMKDRFGAGGWHVYKIANGDYENILSIMLTNPTISFIIQPFTLFDARDMRLIYLDGKLLQSYFRQAKPGDFRCNEHQGGKSTYIKLNSIPKSIMTKANLILTSLEHINTIFALDFIIGISGSVHFIEGNTGPGLTWDENSTKEVAMGKQLIQAIVKNIKSRLPIDHSLPSKNPFLPQASETLFPVVTL